MNGTEIMSHGRERLAEAVRGNHSKNPVVTPFEVSPWAAMSLLQKAIRRGRTELAIRAAATLLRDTPDRLWRRIPIVAAEDIGVADLETLTLATAAVSGKLFRAKIGGEWAVASTIVGRMAAAPKCRAADDLVMVIERHPSLREARHELGELPTRDLLRIATGQGPLPERALATWLAIGTARCPSDHLPSRRGEPDAVFDAFCDAGIPETVVEVAREGLRKTGWVLCPFVSLLAPIWLRQEARIIDDDIPPERSIRGVPSWAFDMFVREGRHALKTFLGQDNATARWMRQHVPPSERVNLLGYILFAVEGGLLRSRLDWETGATLRRLAEHESQGRRCPDGAEIIDLLRADLSLLNGVRADVAISSHPG